MVCLHDRRKAELVIAHLKSILLIMASLEILISDNDPPYNSFAFVNFDRVYGFHHVTSRPHFSKGNKEAEREVQIVKRLLKSNSDLYMSLLSYQSTPLKMVSILLNSSWEEK